MDGTWKLRPRVFTTVSTRGLVYRNQTIFRAIPPDYSKNAKNHCILITMLDQARNDVHRARIAITISSYTYCPDNIRSLVTCFLIK